jgi:hypothetical protein
MNPEQFLILVTYLLGDFNWKSFSFGCDGELSGFWGVLSGIGINFAEKV